MLSEREQQLLRPPADRAAYSDRTAWLMAVLSELAYEPFEPSTSRLAKLTEELAGLDDPAAIREVLDEALATELPALTASGDGVPMDFTAKLDTLGFRLERVISRANVHAYLALREEDRMAVLAFRGTEADYRDILTDINARFYKKPDGAKTHTGFLQAYKRVGGEVREACGKVGEDGYRLYVTGHSLGGALAMIATRDLAADHLAACYTFGSPKVGNEEFGHAIKPPIYRVVNAADVVARIPPRKTIEILYRLLRRLRIPLLSRLLGQMRGYLHWGDMRYLSAARREDLSDVRVIPNPSGLQQLLRALRRSLDDWHAFVTDHAISRYRAKLAAYAAWRNRQPE